MERRIFKFIVITTRVKSNPHKMVFINHCWVGGWRDNDNAFYKRNNFILGREGGMFRLTAGGLLAGRPVRDVRTTGHDL